MGKNKGGMGKNKGGMGKNKGDMGKNKDGMGKNKGGMGDKKEKLPSNPLSKDGMGKNVENVGSKNGMGKHVAKAGANVGSVVDVTSGGSRLPLIAGVVAASVYVIASIVGVFLYYRRNLRLSHELAELPKLDQDGVFEQPGQESPSSAAMSWDHDYQLLSSETAEPNPLVNRTATYALASPTSAARHAPVYANIGEQADSTSRPRLTTRGDTDSTFDWDDTG